MARALQHDPEYAPDPNKESRAEAEKYYMAYLEKDIPSFQRAKVYCQLGVMYTTTANPERGEQRDREKAEKYFQKVLELEPERIGRATIRARTMLSSLHSLPKAEKLSRALKYYEWLSSLDDEKIRSKWLPNGPGETEISSSRMRALRNSVTAAGRTLAKNTVSRAASMPNADILLAEIINRFPDRQIAEFARQKLNTRVDKFANETLDMLAKDEPQEIPLAPQPQPPPPAVEQSQEPPDHNQAQVNPPGASKHPSVAAGHPPCFCGCYCNSYISHAKNNKQNFRHNITSCSRTPSIFFKGLDTVFLPCRKGLHSICIIRLIQHDDIKV